MTDVLADVRAHLSAHFTAAGVLGEPDEASITFLGTDRIDVLRFGPDVEQVNHFVSVGCSRHAMTDPTEFLTDSQRGPRAEVVVSLRMPTPTGLAKSVAVLAAAPAVEGLILDGDALVDLGAPLFEGAPFTAFLLGPSAIGDLELPEPLSPVRFFAATPITPTEAAWVRLKGADAMREAWKTDGVDVLDARRRAANPT
ncbi:suppressor of fused protein [Mycolicibacterium canariasense]|uniref:Suppressor of fused protein n=1 Tax=Mycolicibacterium canariasense TaxID=228230 RepID=A0A100WGY5_MYCCR|nr:suppressor of fused domain protein [Mycolicibacterium canariasense]MCV7210095.1 suppressor of fused domain protein [Mycolicibacterium canariasense]ORV13394.1 Suppressor of fused protein (SUFU) [Mycolicibacterium canariasense]GAS98407.1 suppressor of fused protein [Mycolicibacterium canariasense]